jgi:hypothetical protein
MKPFIKYISLLIISGLILIYYNTGRLSSPVNQIRYAEPAMATSAVKLEDAGYSFYQNVAPIVFPALKF